MARLITTQAEKDATSFLDWDDAALGVYCKKLALVLKAKRRKMREDDLNAVVNASDGLLLLASMVEMNAATMTLRFGDYTHCGDPEGDWEIRVRQLSKPKKKS